MKQKYCQFTRNLLVNSLIANRWICEKLLVEDVTLEKDNKNKIYVCMIKANNIQEKALINTLYVTLPVVLLTINKNNKETHMVHWRYEKISVFIYDTLLIE